MSRYMDHVYINISGMYNEHNLILDINYLINEVAKANSNGDDKILYDCNKDKVFEGRTKRFIVKKVGNFIVNLHEEKSDKNMANYASIRQLEKLMKAPSLKNKRISCYGLVYLYVIYTLLDEESIAASQSLIYVISLYQLVFDYFENNLDNKLAAFLTGCYSSIRKAMESKDYYLDRQKLPFRPRKNPK